MSPPANPRREPGLHLHVRTSADANEFAVVSAAAAVHVPRLDLRAPLLTPESAVDFTVSVTEISGWLLDGDGRVLDAFGWPSVPDVFLDAEALRERVAPRSGRPADFGASDRLWRIPVSDLAVFLMFARSELVLEETADRVVRQRILALFHLRPGEPPFPLPSWPIPGPVPFPLPIPWRVPWKRLVHFNPAKHKVPNRPDCSIKSVETVVDHGASTERFDIVILSEGFREIDLPQFDQLADLLAVQLLNTPPFAAVQHLINVHVVRAASAHSGVDNAPTFGVQRDTCFDVSAYFNGAGFIGYVGTNATYKIFDAADKVVPIEYIDLMVVVVNAPLDGGSAFPENRLAFVTLQADNTKFVNTAVHECGHAIARLADEYINCTTKDPLKSYRNQASEADRIAGTVGWKALALSSELTGNGGFRAEHLYGDPMITAGTEAGQPDMPAALAGMLGAYWGCQNTNTTTPPASCAPWDDPGGATYYRPMAACRMRRMRYPAFCRVCSDALSQWIVAASL
jgi:IgA Peptidase M64